MDLPFPLCGLFALYPLVLGGGPQESPEAATPEKAVLGEVVPDHTFRTFLAGGDGRQRLSEFRGQPVLLVNWTDTDFGRGAAQRVEKLSKKLMPKGLVVILVETHNMPAQEVQAAVMRLYPGSPAWLTQYRKPPFEYQDNGPPPDIALIGVDGTLLVAGSYTLDLNPASELAEAELKRSASGWGEHDGVRRARGLAFGKGRLGASRTAIEALLAEEPDHPEVLAARAEVLARWESRASSVRYFMDGGQYVRARDEAEALAGAAEGHAEWESAAASLLELFDEEQAVRELALDKRLSSLLAPLEKRAPRREPEKLRKFAQEAGDDSPVGKRALHLAEVTALAAGD